MKDKELKLEKFGVFKVSYEFEEVCVHYEKDEVMIKAHNSEEAFELAKAKVAAEKLIWAIRKAVKITKVERYSKFGVDGGSDKDKKKAPKVKERIKIQSWKDAWHL